MTSRDAQRRSPLRKKEINFEGVTSLRLSSVFDMVLITFSASSARPQGTCSAWGTCVQFCFLPCRFVYTWLVFIGAGKLLQKIHQTAAQRRGIQYFFMLCDRVLSVEPSTISTSWIFESGSIAWFWRKSEQTLLFCLRAEYGSWTFLDFNSINKLSSGYGFGLLLSGSGPDSDSKKPSLYNYSYKLTVATATATLTIMFRCILNRFNSLHYFPVQLINEEGSSLLKFPSIIGDAHIKWIKL